MENIRVMLAAFALGLGVLLLIIAFIRSLRKKAPATANWVFSALFLAVGLVLWIRGSDPSMSNFPAATEITAEEESISEKPESTEESALGKTATGPVSDSPEGKLDQATPTAESNKLAASLPRDERIAEKPDKQSNYPQTRPSATPSKLRHERTTDPDSNLSWEDRIYAAIDASFDWIEEFFEEYAAPVAASTQTPKQPKQIEQPSLVFPEIRFNSGTAELTSESQVELKILATRLTAEYPNGILEIQAYVDSVGPEAFNFVLTQARADAVRDLLVAEGVSKSKIIAKGYGTGDDPKLADSRVEFIVRN